MLHENELHFIQLQCLHNETFDPDHETEDKIDATNVMKTVFLSKSRDKSLQRSHISERAIDSLKDVEVNHSKGRFYSSVIEAGSKKDGSFKATNKLVARRMLKQTQNKRMWNVIAKLLLFVAMLALYFFVTENVSTVRHFGHLCESFSDKFAFSIPHMLLVFISFFGAVFDFVFIYLRNFINFPSNLSPARKCYLHLRFFLVFGYTLHFVFVLNLVQFSPYICNIIAVTDMNRNGYVVLTYVNWVSNFKATYGYNIILNFFTFWESTVFYDNVKHRNSPSICKGLILVTILICSFIANSHIANKWEGWETKLV